MTAPARYRLRVQYEDVDLGGVVHHPAYLRFVERGRCAWLRDLGLDLRTLRDREGVVFAVRRVQADYLAPAHLDDLLEVETTPRTASPARLVLGQRIHRGTRLLFAAEVTLVAMTLADRPTRLPALVRGLATQGGVLSGPPEPG